MDETVNDDKNDASDITGSNDQQLPSDVREISHLDHKEVTQKAGEGEVDEGMENLEILTEPAPISVDASSEETPLSEQTPVQNQRNSSQFSDASINHASPHENKSQHKDTIDCRHLSFVECLCHYGATETITHRIQEDIDLLFKLEQYITGRIEMDREYARQLEGWSGEIMAFREVLRSHNLGSQYIIKKTDLVDDNAIKHVRSIIKAKQNILNVFCSHTKRLNDEYERHSKHLNQLKQEIQKQTREFTQRYKRFLETQPLHKSYDKHKKKLYDATYKLHRTFCELLISATDGKEHVITYIEEELPTLLSGFEQQNRFLIDDIKQCLLIMQERLDYTDFEMQAIGKRARVYIEQIDPKKEYQELLQSSGPSSTNSPLHEAIDLCKVKQNVLSTPNTGITDMDNLIYTSTTEEFLQTALAQQQSFSEDYERRITTKSFEMHQKENTILSLNAAPSAIEDEFSDVRLSILSDHISAVYDLQATISSLKANHRLFGSDLDSTITHTILQLVASGRYSTVATMLSSFLTSKEKAPLEWSRAIAIEPACDTEDGQEEPLNVNEGNDRQHSRASHHRSFFGLKQLLLGRKRSSSMVAADASTDTPSVCSPELSVTSPTMQGISGRHENSESQHTLATTGLETGAIQNQPLPPIPSDVQNSSENIQQRPLPSVPPSEQITNESIQSQTLPSMPTTDQTSSKSSVRRPLPPIPQSMNTPAMVNSTHSDASQPQNPVLSNSLSSPVPQPINSMPPTPIADVTTPKPSIMTRCLASLPRASSNTVIDIKIDVPLIDQPFFFGDIPREIAVSLLEQPGDFFVRFSSNKACYIVTVADEHCIARHYVIHDEANGFRLNDLLADSIPALISKHLNDQVPINKAGVNLIYPIQRMEMGDVKAWYNSELVHIENLGKGHFGVVEKMRDIQTGKHYAVKTCLQEELKGVKEFMREAITFSRLQHQHIVCMLGITSDAPFRIVMELCKKGVLLGHLQDNGPFEPHILTKWCQEVCDGMVYLAEKNCIHRDLAARNVLLDDLLTAKISDFGLSRLVTDAESLYTIKTSRQVPIRWTAPEALVHQHFSLKSDVWSYGILMYEVFSGGKMPFAPYSNSEVKELVKKGQILENPGAPAQIYNIMTKCWTIYPEDRISFQEIKSSLMGVECDMIGSSKS